MLNEELERELSVRSDAIDQALSAHLNDSSPLFLDDTAKHFPVDNGGHVRPLVLVLTEEALAGAHDSEHERLMPVAVAVELAATFSEVHGAIVHDAESRRGGPRSRTAGEKTTDILGGDFLYSKAVETLLDASIPSETRSECLSVLLRSCVGFCEGAMLERTFSAESRMTEDEYLAVIERKSGALYEGAAEIGAILGDGDERVVAQIGEYGRNLGLATHLSDEVRMVAAARTNGRTERDRSGQSTLATVHARGKKSEYHRGDQARIEAVVRASPDLEELGSIDDLHRRTVAYASAAKSQLDVLSESVAKTLLRELADRAVLRASITLGGSADHA